MYRLITTFGTYRGMTVGDDIHCPMNSNACSWTPSLESAEYFAGLDNYVENIRNDNDVAYAVIYQLEGFAINLNKISNYLVNYVEDNIEEFENFEEFEYIKDTYNSYKDEEEFITNFDLEQVSEISRHECAV